MNARRILIGLGLVILLTGGAAWAYVRSQKPMLDLAVGYGARVACGCRHIGNRSLDDCKKDFEPGMELVRLREDAAKKSVTAYVPLLASRTAIFDPILGCQPEPFRE
jgi:hypothetical protein